MPRQRWLAPVVLLIAGSVWAGTPFRLVVHLTREAIQAVKRWHYQPASRDGEPIAATISVTVKF